MSGTCGTNKNETYTGESRADYFPARTEKVTIPDKTYQYSIKVQTAPTSRTSGEVRIRIASREMPEPKRITSTK